MSNRAQSHFLKIYNSSTVFERWQNYYVNSTITYDDGTGNQSWLYYPFVTNGLTSSSASGGNSISIEVPATKKAVDAFVKALARGYFCRILVFEFDSRLSHAAPTSQTTIIDFSGIVSNIDGTFTSLSINLGSALSPVGAQAPPRRFTTFQVGAPIRL